MNCPDCGVTVYGDRCAPCGWTAPGAAPESKPQCLLCKKQPAERKWAGKCERCGRCHGYTNGARCAFRAESFPGGSSGYCGWHERAASDPQANTLEEFVAWIAVLLKSRYCDRWTHYTPAELWTAMQGDGRATAKWCGGADCRHRDQPLIPGGVTEAPKRADAPENEVRDEAWRNRVMAQARQLGR